MKPNLQDGYSLLIEVFAVGSRKVKIRLKKPEYLGQSILDLSKTLMCKFYYDLMQPKYENEVMLSYMNTNNFVYEKKLEIFAKTLQNIQSHVLIQTSIQRMLLDHYQY